VSGAGTTKVFTTVIGLLKRPKQAALSPGAVDYVCQKCPGMGFGSRSQ
jgi:hypothetical protein